MVQLVAKVVHKTLLPFRLVRRFCGLVWTARFVRFCVGFSRQRLRF